MSHRIKLDILSTVHRELKKDNPLSLLLSMQKRTTKSVLKNKNGDHMICFPMYWFKQWSSRFVNIRLNENIFVYTVEKQEMATDKLLKVGDTHYIRLSDDIMKEINYPEILQMNFYETYLEISVPKHELEKIKLRMKDIERKKRNEEMRRKYARLI